MASKKLHSSQRRDMILAALRRERMITVPQMAELCNASDMTIRRDFDFLEEHGLLARNHGGAVLPDALIGKRFDMVEPSLDRRIALNHGAKFRIATMAAEHVEPNQTIALDVGSTVFELADRIREMPVSIFTTSLRIAGCLSDGRARVYLPGGEVHGTEPSIVGARTIDDLGRLYFDVAFIGVSGMSVDGFFDYSLEDTEVKKAMITRSKKTIVLLDSSKFDCLSVAQVCDLSLVDMLITDEMPPEPLQDALNAAGVEILTAPAVVTKMDKGTSNGL